jgi:zinc and cadmium transporter
LAVILHEIPQEIGDFGVLLHAGFKKSQALFYNFIIALMGFFGIFIGYFLINRVEHINEFLLPLAAGGFIYIAASDLIPELHKESNLKKSILSFVIFLLALVFMYVVKFLEM